MLLLYIYFTLFNYLSKFFTTFYSVKRCVFFVFKRNNFFRNWPNLAAIKSIQTVKLVNISSINWLYWRKLKKGNHLYWRKATIRSINLNKKNHIFVNNFSGLYVGMYIQTKSTKKSCCFYVLELSCLLNEKQYLKIIIIFTTWWLKSINQIISEG